MRVVSWNLGRQTREAPNPALLQFALSVRRPEVLVLNEFVDGPTRATLREGLSVLGLSHIRVSERVGRHNQVLIASTTPVELGALKGPEMPGGAGESNFLHVHLQTRALEVVGLRVPAYKTSRDQHEYWSQLATRIRENVDRRIVWIGDLNADPDSPAYVGGRYLAELRADGLQLPRPEGEWSFARGTCIDHVIAAPAVNLLSAEYVSVIEGIAVASLDPGNRVSDHAALVAGIGQSET